MSKLIEYAMPVGVPTVPFGLPDEEEDDDWVNLYNVLYRERILFLCNELDEELANQLIGILLHTRKEDERAEEEAKKAGTKFEIKEALLYINSPGGAAMHGIGLFDAMKYAEIPVHTIGAGTVASVSALILANGFLGTRLAFPHARIMLRQPHGEIDSQTGNIEIELEEIQKLRIIIATLLSDCTCQPLNKIFYDSTREVFLSSLFAQIYGIVDNIANAMDGFYYFFSPGN